MFVIICFILIPLLRARVLHCAELCFKMIVGFQGTIACYTTPISYPNKGTAHTCNWLSLFKQSIAIITTNCWCEMDASRVGQSKKRGRKKFQ